MGSSAAENLPTAEAASQPNRSPWCRSTSLCVVLVFSVLAIGLGGYTLFGPSPPIAQGILTATEDDDADHGYRQAGTITSAPTIAATAAKLESNVSVAAVSSSATSGGHRFFDRTLAIYNLDDDLLMQCIGLALFEQLRDEGRFEQIRYLPAGERLPDGERLPEVFVTLEKTSWQETGLPGMKQFKGELVISASDQFRRSSSSYTGDSSPPQANYRWRADIDYTAKQTGIETSGARYQAISRDLAKDVATRLTKLFDTLASDHGTPGELPEQFYPNYMEPPKFDFLAELGAEKLHDGPQFMAHTVAVWQISSGRTPQDVFDSVSRSLTKAGWIMPEGQGDPGNIRATSGDQVVEVFKDDDGRTTLASDAERPTTMFVVYRRSMSEEDLDAALKTMFLEAADESTLVMFQNRWYQHRELVEQYFSSHTAVQADSWLQLARLHKDSDPEAARQAVLKANALAWIFQQKSPESSLQKLAEELGIEKLPQQISHEMVMMLRLQELREPGEIEVTVHQDQPMPIWLADDGDQQSWLLLTANGKRGAKSKGRLRIEMLNLRDGGWSRSAQTADLSQLERPIYIQTVGGGEQLQIFRKPTDDDRLLRLRMLRSNGKASVN